MPPLKENKCTAYIGNENDENKRRATKRKRKQKNQNCAVEARRKCKKNKRNFGKKKTNYEKEQPIDYLR